MTAFTQEYLPLISDYSRVLSTQKDSLMSIYHSYRLLLDTCSVANQVQACDVDLSCVACVCYPTCVRQNHVQQCVHMPVFEVLHVLNVQAHACTCTCV